MILRNWYKIFGMNWSGKNTTAVDQNGVQKGVYKTGTYYGTVFHNAKTAYDFDLATVNTSSSTSNSGVMFGTGIEPATFDDYKLSGNIISGLSVNTSQTFGVDENGAYITTVYTLQNTNTSNVTIGEVGATITCCSSTSTMANTRYAALVERTVLDTPVTIPAGGVGQVTYTVRVNYPTA